MLTSTPSVLRLQRTIVVGKVSPKLTTYLTIVNLSPPFPQRAYHDLVTLPNKKPAISYGPPGYSAVSGRTVTVFGCTGFLGRYLVSKLGTFTNPRVERPSALTPVFGFSRKDGHASNCSIPRRG